MDRERELKIVELQNRSKILFRRLSAAQIVLEAATKELFRDKSRVGLGDGFVEAMVQHDRVQNEIATVAFQLKQLRAQQV